MQMHIHTQMYVTCVLQLNTEIIVYITMASSYMGPSTLKLLKAYMFSINEFQITLVG